jgi:uncharacterized Ntn-hydrolase superfamily protein
MKSILLIVIHLIYLSNLVYADTFSIVAIDPLTGEVGSAGASCFPASCRFLSDIHPGIGVIHTQAAWNQENQDYARQLMNLGLSPQQIIDSLIIHDANNNPSYRQYGIIDLINGGRSAAYTGTNCQNWKGHTTGQTYSIQGNCLLGQQIIDSMRSRFLNTPGELAVRLMAALQGANVIGADNRCLNNNTSSLSAFIRVAKPIDTSGGHYYLDLDVPHTIPGVDPIDSLQTLFNMWLLTGIKKISNELPEDYALYQNYPNPFNPTTTIRFDILKQSNVKLFVYDILGREVGKLVYAEKLSAGSYTVDFDATDLSSGIYVYRIHAGGFSYAKKMLLIK